jgi:hypothetical protein
LVIHFKLLKVRIDYCFINKFKKTLVFFIQH